VVSYRLRFGLDERIRFELDERIRFGLDIIEDFPKEAIFELKPKW
jgi:hypothetical protein